MTPSFLEIGEEPCLYLTESQHLQQSASMSFWTRRQVRMQVVSSSKSCQGQGREEIARFERNIQEMPAISTLLEANYASEALLKNICDEAYRSVFLKRNPFSNNDCSHERFYT